ncbi:MAG: molybdenum ABC transporter ATP-binding protein [Steroidobacteraceae bacterium]
MLEVALRYRRDDFALEVEFCAPTPGVTALFGRSGAGKSTITQLIAGLWHADAGRVVLDGRVLFDSQRAIDLRPEARRIGYVFQDLRLFPHLDVAANLRYGQRRAGADTVVDWPRAIELLELGSLLLRRTNQLSGGERQRVALGRALLAQPQLLLLDEPLAAIDARKRSELLPYFERLRDELSLPMILVTHQFEDLLRLATRVVLLDSGRVSAQGELTTMSLQPQMRALLGPEAVGAVIEGQVESLDAASGLAAVTVGQERLLLPHSGLVRGKRVRLQLLARDLILATALPQGLSVRNQLSGLITDLEPDGIHNVLVSIEAAGATLLARVTSAASSELQLRRGLPVWVLVKAVSLQGHGL